MTNLEIAVLALNKSLSVSISKSLSQLQARYLELLVNKRTLLMLLNASTGPPVATPMDTSNLDDIDCLFSFFF